ncbi:MAG TPA: Npt1/Npt2 family nucleotide transporter [Steroidobacteraceae bacterium]|nr:Npt1/Npt2 family nucleotide transporter [Steroidobacteraceae bacterium]
MKDHDGLSRFERLLGVVTRIRPGEGRSAFLFLLHGFLLLSSYQIVKALREALMLTKFSAEVRAYAVAMTALVLIFVVPLYGYVRRHVDGERLLRLVTLFFVVTLPLFAGMVWAGAPIEFLFFIWVSIYGLMVISQMWAFAADTFNLKSGQRLFPAIMIGANLGALVGAKTAQFAAATLSVAGLMILATATLAATLLLAGPERASVPEGSRAATVEGGRPVPRLLGGIGLVLRDRYLLQIALLAILLNWINSTGEFILADFFKDHAERRVAADPSLDVGALLTAYYGNFQFWVTVGTLAIQLFLVARIFRAVGIRGALLVHPGFVAIGYGLIALLPLLGGFIPIFTLIFIVKVMENSLDYSLMNTTRQALFLPVDRDSKYDGKTAIDTFFWRFGDLVQAGAIYAGTHLLQWQATEFALLNFCIALAWIALAVAIGRGFTTKAQENVINVAPEAADPIPDLSYSPGQSFLHPIAPTAFRDADPGDVLHLRACCEDGRPLPRWLQFDARRRAFFGTGPSTVEELRVAVVASDVDGMEARSVFIVRSETVARRVTTG